MKAVLTMTALVALIAAMSQAWTSGAMRDAALSAVPTISRTIWTEAEARRWREVER